MKILLRAQNLGHSNYGKDIRQIWVKRPYLVMTTLLYLFRFAKLKVQK